MEVKYVLLSTTFLLFLLITTVSADEEYRHIGNWGSMGGPIDLAIDSNDNVYQCLQPGWAIWKNSPNGSLLAQWDYPINNEGCLFDPFGIGLDRDNNVYVATQDHTRNQIKKYTPDGVFVTSWGPRASADNPSDNGCLYYPTDVAVDSLGNVYVIDTLASIHIHKFSSDGVFLSRFGDEGTLPGQFHRPFYIAIDNADNIYVTDTGNNRIQKISPNGGLITTWGTFGTGDRQFNGPAGIAVDSAGNVYVGDSGNYRIQKFTSNGTFITKWGTNGTADGQFRNLWGVAVDHEGIVYVTDSHNNRIQLFSAIGDLSVASITPNVAISTTEDVSISLRGTGFVSGTTFQLVNTTLGTITCKPGALTRVSDTELTGQISLTDAHDGLYDVVVTTPSGTIARLEKGFCVDVGNISVSSISPDTAVSTVEDVGVTVRGTGFSSGTTFTLVNTTLGTISCKPETLTRISNTELRGTLSFSDAKEGLYDVIVTTPSGATARLEKGFRVLRVPVVLVHGWQSNPGVWDALMPALEKEGIPYWNFGSDPRFVYDPRVDPTISAGVLATYIRDKRVTFRPDLYPSGYTGKIDIVCHSMGAIVSRWYMEHDGHGNEVRQWIGIAPAHGGSGGADLLGSGDQDATETTLFKEMIYSKLGDSTRYLKTTTDPAMYLKYDQLSPSTTYRIIAGWNPYHNARFGYGALYRTRAAAPDGSHYWTFNGDMIVATVQSTRTGMGFEVFPKLNGGVEGGANEPGWHFDHVHIHHSPAVLNRIIEYLTNPEHTLVIEHPVDTYLESMPYDLPPTEAVISDVILPGALDYVIEHIILVPLKANVLRGDTESLSVAGTTVTDMLYVDLNWTEGNLSLELTDPNGQKYTPATDTARVWSTSDSNRIIFTIVAPTAGNWSAKIVPLSLPHHPIRYNLTTYRSNVNATLEEEIPTMTTVPGGTGTPTDINNDGKREDVNGNGRNDFADVVLYFNQMIWIAANEPPGPFDYTGNGRVDFADVVRLFERLGAPARGTFTVTAAAIGPGIVQPSGHLLVREGEDVTFTLHVGPGVPLPHATQSGVIVGNEVVVDPAVMPTLHPDNDGGYGHANFTSSYTLRDVRANHTVYGVFYRAGWITC